MRGRRARGAAAARAGSRAAIGGRRAGAGRRTAACHAEGAPLRRDPGLRARPRARAGRIGSRNWAARRAGPARRRKASAHSHFPANSRPLLWRAYRTMPSAACSSRCAAWTWPAPPGWRRPPSRRSRCTTALQAWRLDDEIRADAPVVVSPDGISAATLAADGALEVWDLPTLQHRAVQNGRPRLTFPGRRNHLCVQPGGYTAGMGRWAGSDQARKHDGRRDALTLAGNAGGVSELHFSADGSSPVELRRRFDGPGLGSCDRPARPPPSAERPPRW